MINISNIETLYEKPWLKFRDSKHWSWQENPCSELMALAREMGIRPQTTSNGIKNMFFIHESHIENFFDFMLDKYPEFTKTVMEKMQTDKENKGVSNTEKLPQWF